MTTDLDELRASVDVERAIKLLHNYEHGRRPTELLHELAEIIVDLRETCTRTDGIPDWSGRTPAYRQIIVEIFQEAGVFGARAGTIRGALRYHVANLLRERATAEELETVGMSPKTAKQRLTDRRHVQRRIRHAEQVVLLIAELHQPDAMQGRWCAECGVLCPCPTMQLIDAATEK